MMKSPLILWLILSLCGTAEANPYEIAAQREAQEAIQNGRFAELKGLTNSQEDQAKALSLCQNYRGNDQRICGEVASSYMKEGDAAAKTRSQAEDDAAVKAAASHLSAAARPYYEQCVASTQSRGSKADQAARCADAADEELTQLQKTDSARAERQGKIDQLRAGLTDESEREQFDTCVAHGTALDDSSNCSDSAQKGYHDKMALDDLRACEASEGFRMWQIAQNIAETNMTIALAQANLDRDKKAEQISGVINLQVREEAGQVLVAGPEVRDKAFAEYKSLGGTESSADDMASGPDPCQALR